MRLLRNEQGGVFVLSAIMIPVFLLLTALVVDAGNWFTHKRQLQDRADAAAFAAGYAYSQTWKGCVQNSDPALKAASAQRIADIARQFAADPEGSDYTSGVVPAPLYNANIANQNNLDVVINSTTYDDDTGGVPNDYTDDYDGNASTRLGDPCYKHPSATEGSPDVISPAGGQWTDVRVRERDTGAIWRNFMPTIPARARIEIHPAISATGLLPLGIPNNIITKVQVRYYDECLDPGHTGTPLAKINLAPLPDADQVAYGAAGGGTLWGYPSAADPKVGDPNHSFPLLVRPYDPIDCGSLPYRPIGVQVRLASADAVNLDDSCASLAASKFADCFSRLSQIRVHETGSAAPQPRVTNVDVTGGCTGLTDPYFGPIPVDRTDCRFGASVEVNWGDRADSPRNVSSNFSVKVNGVALNPPGPTTPSGIWTTTGTPIVANPGTNPVTVEVDWADTDTTHSYGGAPCKNGASNPCSWNGPVEPAHQIFAATQATAGAVEMVRTSRNGFASGLPGPAFANSPGSALPIDVFATVATRSVLKTGVLTTLRLGDPQANQTLRCDPQWTNGQEFKAFRFGCKPSYGQNTMPTTGSIWWDPSTKKCPSKSSFFPPNGSLPPYPSSPTFGQNTAANPFRCVPTSPGLSVPVIGEGLSAATGNCSNPLPDDPSDPNSCMKTDCLVDGNYDGKPGSPMGWLQRGGPADDPRVVTLFIIPYQSLKGSTGGDPEETVPVWGIASFYVMNWTGSNAGNSDPCPDRTFGATTVPDPEKGAAVGVFIEAVFPQTGPVDPKALCTEGMLFPCRAVLVR